jgi:general secretion pathway protein M
MNRKLPVWVGRAAALSLLAALLALPYFFVIAPYRAASEAADAEIAELQDGIARLEKVAAAGPALARQLEDVARAAAPQQFYLAGATDALAAAELQASLQSLVAANAGQLRSIQVLPAGETDGFRRVALRVELSAPLAGLYPLLYRLETGTPYLVIEAIDIDGPPEAPGAKPAAAPMLNASFVVVGYMPAAMP